MNMVNDNNFVLFKTEDRPSTLMVGFFPSARKQSQTMVSNVISLADKLPEKTKRSITHVEFMPMSSVPGVQSYEEWAEAAGLEYDEPSNMHEYLLYLKKQDADQKMDETWEKYMAGHSVYLGALGILMNGVGSYVPRATFTEKIKIHEHVTKRITDKCELLFGAGNVFVSKQLITIRAILEHWSEFYDQAEAFLLHNERFRKPMYDEQQHQAGVIYLPGYAIPIGIKRVWPRTVCVQEHNDFLDSLLKPIDDNHDLNASIREVDDFLTTCEPRILSNPELRQMRNGLIDAAYDVAYLQGYRLPGQPSPFKCKLRRFTVLATMRAHRWKARLRKFLAGETPKSN